MPEEGVVKLGLILSQKFKEFLTTLTKREYLEGTTAAGKTTVGIFKFMLMVTKSERKFHVIAAKDLGTAEKNIINGELGLLTQFAGLTVYYGNGRGNVKMPHIEYEARGGQKIIYITSYGNKATWEKVLGGQYGCVYIDEVNIADIEFVREITHRCEYMMTTSNPDDPNLPIYKEFLNRSRPLKKYEKDYPQELLEQLNEPQVPGWVHWYFTFYDNAALTEKQIQDKIDAVAVGTKMYKNKIQGLRGRATGLVFPNFSRKRHVITKEQAKKMKFVQFSAGLDTSYSQQSEDTMAFTFIGITDNKKVVLLEEEAYNNKNQGVPLAPSDIALKYFNFMAYCSREWGIARDCFVDCADQATITELNKLKRQKGSIHNFINSYKKVVISDRIGFMLSWLTQGYYLVVNTCTEHIKELESYSWKEDKDEPEDRNDHTINSFQYAWIPFRKIIGEYKEGEGK